jgi:hypothetical protein
MRAKLQLAFYQGAARFAACRPTLPVGRHIVKVAGEQFISFVARFESAHRIREGVIGFRCVRVNFVTASASAGNHFTDFLARTSQGLDHLGKLTIC